MCQRNQYLQQCNQNSQNLNQVNSTPFTKLCTYKTTSQKYPMQLLRPHRNINRSPQNGQRCRPLRLGASDRRVRWVLVNSLNTHHDHFRQLRRQKYQRTSFQWRILCRFNRPLQQSTSRRQCTQLCRSSQVTSNRTYHTTNHHSSQNQSITNDHLRRSL